MDSLSPAQLIADLAKAHIVARCLHVIADSGVADAVGDAETTAAAIAVRTNLNPDALERMLRLLAAHGIFVRGEHGYAHTPASELLRSDHPQSLRSYVRMTGMPAFWNGFTALATAAKAGRPAADWASLVAYFAEHADEASVFNAAMVSKSQSVIPAVVEAYDFSGFGVIADIGGGRGHLLQAILDRVPAASGILFEVAHVIADAVTISSPRLHLATGDFFVDALPVADAYVLMDLIHDWSDNDAAKILSAVRRAAPAHARLLIIETLVPEAPGPHFGKTLDIIMLAITGGRERTSSEYAALLAAAGFRLQQTVATKSQYSIVEALVT